jgi:hypothetical protein
MLYQVYCVFLYCLNLLTLLLWTSAVASLERLQELSRYDEINSNLDPFSPISGGEHAI